MGDTPTQVRVRTDPADGYGHRYDAIQEAKGVFSVGNNTDAIVLACDHAREDRNAKRAALETLAKNADPELVAAVADELSTSALPLSVTTRVEDGSVFVDVHVGED